MRPKEDILPFFIEDKSITVTAKDSISEGSLIKGSQANDDNIAVTELLRPYYQQV